MILCVARCQSFHHEIILDGRFPSLKYLSIMINTHSYQSEEKADNMEARTFASQSSEHRHRVPLMLSCELVREWWDFSGMHKMRCCCHFNKSNTLNTKKASVWVENGEESFKNIICGRLTICKRQWSVFMTMHSESLLAMYESAQATVNKDHR